MFGKIVLLGKELLLVPLDDVPPAILDLPGRNARVDAPRIERMLDHRHGSNDRPVSDVHTGKDDAPGTDDDMTP